MDGGAGRHVVQQLVSLLKLESGWDSYGAPPISPIATQQAHVFLVTSKSPRRPSIVPTAKGGVQLEWHDGDVDVEIECLPSGSAKFYAEESVTREVVERWVVPGHPVIAAWLQKLRT